MICAHKYQYAVNLWELTLTTLGAIENLADKIPVNYDIILHCGVEGKHSPTGYHPRGKAIDMHMEYKGEIISIKTQYEIAQKFWRGGIGVYPYWSHPGLHLDTGEMKRRWWQDKDETYKPISELVFEEI